MLIVTTENSDIYRNLTVEEWLQNERRIRRHVYS
jgi:hypothetical protein